MDLRLIRAYCIAVGKLLTGLVTWADLGVDDEGQRIAFLRARSCEGGVETHSEGEEPERYLVVEPSGE